MPGIVGEEGDCERRTKSDGSEQWNAPIVFNTSVVADDSKQQCNDRGMSDRIDFSELKPCGDKHSRQHRCSVAPNQRSPTQSKRHREFDNTPSPPTHSPAKPQT